MEMYVNTKARKLFVVAPTKDDLESAETSSAGRFEVVPVKDWDALETKASEAETSIERGFVNLNTTDNNDSKGDGKWYPLSSGKTQHDGDTAMTRGAAIAAKIELG